MLKNARYYVIYTVLCHVLVTTPSAPAFWGYILFKLAINQTKLLLKLNANVLNTDVNAGHSCENCKYKTDETITLPIVIVGANS